MEKKFKFPDFNYEVILGKYAQQADGAAWLQQGGTVVLSTIVSAPSSDFPGFLPLTTDYREQYAAAGKIPGGYFKREGKFSDKEILVSRLIDRAIRPLFPSNYFDQLQSLTTVYSIDKQHLPYTLAILATSIALVTSKIPFLGPIGAVEVGRLDGKWVLNPTFEQTLQSDVKITVAGTEEGITMVEGRTNQITESEFLDALFLAHDTIKKQIEWQNQIVKELAVQKEEVKEIFDFKLWKMKADEYLSPQAIDTLFVSDKVKRGKIMSELKESFLKLHQAEAEELDISNTFIGYMFDQALKDKLTEAIFNKNLRIDGRDFDQVRNIVTEVGLLPFNHGSALFNRGKTQALVSVTLGGGQDEQRVEDIVQDTIERTFMLHYNFHPFSAGDIRPNRGPGRREIGHGFLAASSFKYVLPTSDRFPYTIRVVADILESDGSTSMATVCGSTMALMNAGVPITDMVSGVAMGLLVNEKKGFKVLTDIAGIEDAFGLMDFKVTGTDKGITAIQMDIKYKGGLKREVFEMALEQARQGRLHILNEMRKVMTHPSPRLSELVPQIVSFKISKDKIGAVIGQGGKVIKEIIERTSTTIDIEEDGTVKIFGQAGAGLDQAVILVKALSGQIEKGSQFKGRIKKNADFGVFVEIAPGLDGLIRIQNMPKELQANYKSALKIGDTLQVQVVDYDEQSGRISLKLVE